MAEQSPALLPLDPEEEIILTLNFTVRDFDWVESSYSEINITPINEEALREFVKESWNQAECHSAVVEFVQDRLQDTKESGE